jgi:hypothetical protein
METNACVLTVAGVITSTGVGVTQTMVTDYVPLNIAQDIII